MLGSERLQTVSLLHAVVILARSKSALSSHLQQGAFAGHSRDTADSNYPSQVFAMLVRTAAD